MNNRWEIQRNANILAFLTDPEYRERKNLLKKICDTLAAEGVTWGLAFSSSLFLRGIVDDFNDFDILVKIEDASKLQKSLTKLGIRLNKQTPQKGVFTSPYFQQGRKGSVEFDLIGDITINTFNTTFRYQVNLPDLEWLTLDGGLYVPVVPMEANLVLYGMMEGWQAKRLYKRELCRKFLSSQPQFQHRNVLEQALEDFDLPEFIEEIVRSLLEKN